MNYPATLRAALRAKFSPERFTDVLAALPPEAREKIKQAFEPKPAKSRTRIRR